MTTPPKVYVLGCGAVGMTLAASLASQGRDVIAVRTSQSHTKRHSVTVKVSFGQNDLLTVPVEMVSLSALDELAGIIVIAAKSFANPALATQLEGKAISGPLVVMQNGIGVERAFPQEQFMQIHRCVLYVTAQVAAPNEVTFRSIASCPMGVIRGQEFGLTQCVNSITTPAFPFHVEHQIQREVWRKVIINAVFNSICPLLDVDNGIFVRDREVLKLAKTIVNECLTLAHSQGAQLSEAEVIGHIVSISHGSQGILISTLQDIRHGRETEMQFLNLGMARIASATEPPIDIRGTELLGQLVMAKARSMGEQMRLSRQETSSNALPS